MKLKGVELVFVSLAIAAVFFTAGYFTGRGRAGDIAVTVEKREVEPTSGGDADSAGLVDLNTADRWQLMSLPGIGETLADRIISYREEHGSFTYEEELMSVPGIGEALFDEIADNVIV